MVVWGTSGHEMIVSSCISQAAASPLPPKQRREACGEKRELRHVLLTGTSEIPWCVKSHG